MESVSGCLQMILNAIGMAHPVMLFPPPARQHFDLAVKV
jgi:hypothetical protein